MKKNLVIISAGKFGRETFTWAIQAIAHGAPWQVKGFLDDRVNALDGLSYDAGILGNVMDYKIEEEDVFVGAGSVVLKDVPPGVKVFGNPAIPVGRVEGVGGSKPNR